jgi:fructose-1,6-bisphosphatase/inositol monophosphatase family enzyme
MTVDTAKVAGFIKACAEEIVLPAFRNLGKLEIGLKGPNDVVTEADIASEAFLTPKLLDLLPGSVVVGEETVGDEANWRETLRTAPAAWLIDPIDGTANFASGIPLYGIMVALVEHGETTHAWIYDPNTDEMATAQRGAGATLNGSPLKTSGSKSLDAMQGSLNTRFAEVHHAQAILAASRKLPPSIEFRCAVHTYIYLAGGRTEYAIFYKLFPWDHAAGVFLHREAGGFTRHIDGSEYVPGNRPFGNPLLLAPSEADWDELRALLFPDA